MSSTESSSPSVGPFRLGERLSNAVWKAEDTRSGKQIALKLLTKGLPKDQARRDAMIREVRLAAALYHAFMVPILEILQVGDNLVMVMEVVDGQPLSKLVKGKALDRTEFFRIAYQLADVVKFLHMKNLVHGNLTGDAVLVTPTGQVKLGGLNLMNLMQRRDGAAAYQQRGNDVRSVAYMAPEQIMGGAMDAKTDVFALGVLFYEMGTGRRPWEGETGPEIARKLVDEQPPSPKALNPNVDNAVLAVMGGCLFKDPFRRFPDAKALTENIIKAAPEAQQFASDLQARATLGTKAQAAAAAGSATKLIFVADVANYEQLAAIDKDAAAKAASRMQQVLGEAVYLFDGSVVDPFGPRMIAELPSVESALEAARKGEYDFSQESQEGSAPQVRMLLHAGEVATEDGGAIGGEGVTRALQVLSQLPPFKLFISEDFTKHGRGNVRLRDAGARGGVKLFNIVPGEDEGPKEITTAELEQIAAEEEAEEAAAQAAAAAVAKKKKRKQNNMLVAAIAAVVAIGGGLFVVMGPKGGGDEVAPVAEAPSGPTELPPASAATPRKVMLAPFTVEGADPALTQQANDVRLASIEILRSFPELRIADQPAADVTPFGAVVRVAPAAVPTTSATMIPTATSATTPPAAPVVELVPQATGDQAAAGTAAPLTDVASGVQAVVDWVAGRVKMNPRPLPAAPAVNAFAAAVVARAANDEAKVDASLREAIKADPTFLAAQLMGMKFFEGRGDERSALESAKQVATLQPSNLDAARLVSRASLGEGNVTQAFASYGAILKADANNLDALNTAARYAVGVGDQPTFSVILGRLRFAPPSDIAVHEPDMLVAGGKIDEAIDRYYDIEVNVPNNPALALKIGRIGILRRTMSVVDIELGKLQQSDPNYGYHILSAYLAAERGDKAKAAAELKAALPASRPGDDYWTSAAEIYAIGGDPRGVLDALEKAVARKEPTANYILTNRLFAFVATDARYLKVRQTLAAQTAEIKGALAQLPL